VYRALFVHDFLELRVVVPRLLATQIALDNCDFLVWLALSGISQLVPLTLVEVVVAIALLVVVALGEAVVLLILLVSPPCHHVVQLYSSSQAIAPEDVVCVLREEPILEAADDVLSGDVGDGGARLEEMPGVGPQDLVYLLLFLGQIMASTCSDHGSLEVVDEGLFEVLPRVDGVCLEAFKPREGCGLQSHREVESFGGVGSP
jgi:hypothetical protein